MTVSAIRHGPRLIVQVSGDLDMATAPGALAELDQLVTGQTPDRLVIDLGRVLFMDSSGLSLLVEVRKLAKALGFDVVLTGVGTRHRRLLDAVHMTELFPSE